MEYKIKDIILTEEMDIKPNETAGELGARMSVVGANLLIRVIEQIENGTATYTKQSFIESSVTTRRNKEDGKITQYRLDNGDVIDKEQCVQMVKN